jgi:hypothetical protein
LNLLGEIKGDYGYQQSNQRLLPSVWLLGDFQEKSDISGSYEFLSPIVGNENKFRIKGSTLQINGWTVKFEYSDISTSDLNEITVPAPPVAGTRTDLVVLEIWRALLSPFPSVANKSPTGLILRHGNVKAPDAVNFVDDLIDPTYTLESTKRVQIQYRYRVIQGVNITTYPDGLDDPVVFANSVSDFSGPGADGSVTIYNYSAMSGDSGLWVAGTGNAASATAIGTVDGYMYAIPICAVFRRNTTAFDRTLNLNGGSAILSGTSTRPDGLFNDQIAINDVKDLRKTVFFDFLQPLQKGSQQLLNNNLSTNHETLSGVTGTSVLVKDDISLTGVMISSDQVRFRFSDRSITERITVRVDVGGVGVAFIPLSLAALPIATDSTITTVNVVANSPPTTKFSGVGEIRVVDFVGITDTQVVFGAGANDISSISIIPAAIQINFNVSSLTNVSYFIIIEIEYPIGSGLSRNFLNGYELWTPNPGGGVGQLPVWATAAQFTTSPVPSDVNRSELSTTRWSTDRLHRELSVSLLTTTQTVSFPAATTTTVKIPERIDSVVSLNGGALAVVGFTYNEPYTTITFFPAVILPSLITVDYVAIRALPVVSGAPADSYQIFYESRAIQSLDVPAGNVTLDLIPRSILNELAVMQVGSGSPDDCYPYIDPSSQIPVSATPSPNYPEARLNSLSIMSISSFSSNFGFAQLGTVIPYSPDTGEVVLERQAGDNDIDAEGRHFWARGDASFYLPSAYTLPIAGPTRHKTALFTIMELKSDFASIGRKGTLVLVVFSTWNEIVTSNSITLLSVPSGTGASVYRLRGNPLNPHRTNT